MRYDTSLDSELREKLNRAGNNNVPITNTLRWRYSIYKKGFGDTCDLFYDNAPIKSAPYSSKRILITGTNYEINKLSQNPRKLLKKAIKDKIERERIERDKPEFTYCSEVGEFWKEFFREDDFLDSENITIPNIMIATGKMRNYLMICGAPRGENLDVTDRLNEIAKDFKIGIYIIKSFSH